MVWARCNKQTFQSKKVLEISVTCAVSEFNISCERTLKLRSSIDNQNISEVAQKISTARDSQIKKKSNLERIQYSKKY